MIFGSPIVISEGGIKRDFVPLNTISARRDDTNSFQETLLQELVDSSPQVLPIRDYLPSKALFSLGREVPVDLGGSQGFIDNLLVTNDGHLVIVETKLYRNPEAIREVITQTMQYAMAVGNMSMLELEARIKSGQKPSLQANESIRDCIERLATEQSLSSHLADNFEETFERNLRRGELLLLIVSDGIHMGVERIAHWLNEQRNSSPFKLGLVELKFYTIGNNRLVIPRTVMKTREVSRHVVVVDIRPTTGITATAEVTDGSGAQEYRPVKAAPAPITKNQLLQLIATDDRQAASQLIEQLELYRFDLQATGSYLRFGFTYPAEGGDFHPLIYLGQSGVWLQPLKQIRDLLGTENIGILHNEANQFARFYRDDQLDKPDSSGCVGRYRKLQEDVNGFVAFLDSWRSKTVGLLEANDAL